MAAYVSTMFSRFDSEVFNDPARFPLVDNNPTPLPEFSIPLTDDVLSSSPQLNTEELPPERFTPTPTIDPNFKESTPQSVVNPHHTVGGSANVKERLAAIIAKSPVSYGMSKPPQMQSRNSASAMKGFVNLPSAKSPIAPNILPVSIT